MRTRKLDASIESVFNGISTDEIYRYLEESVDVTIAEDFPEALRGIDDFSSKKIAILEAFALGVEKTNDEAFQFIDEFKPPILLPLSQYFESVFQSANLNRTIRKFSARVEVVLEETSSILAERSSEEEPPTLMGDKQVYVKNCKLFNQIIASVREILRSSKFKNLLRRREEKSRANFRSGAQYIEDMYGVWTKLMVERVDLGYRDGVFSKSDLRSTASLYQIQKDISRLHNNMRSNKIFKHLVGRIAKLEFGTTKGYHYHCFFFYNGHERQNDEHIAQEICKYWEEDITKGKGLAHNCNRRWKDRRGSGLGVIHFNDAHKRTRLLVSLGYVTKSDQHVDIHIPVDGPHRKPAVRCFIRGQVDTSEPKSGRPRKPMCAAIGRSSSPYGLLPNEWIDESHLY